MSQHTITVVIEPDQDKHVKQKCEHALAAGVITSYEPKFDSITGNMLYRIHFYRAD